MTETVVDQLEAVDITKNDAKGFVGRSRYRGEKTTLIGSSTALVRFAAKVVIPSSF
jgi:hypothetical protein